MREPSWRREGQEPDYRFSLANERTFLAWIRTALSLLAGGVLLDQFASRLSPRGLVLGVAVVLTVLAALLCLAAYTHWRANEIAMRHARALPGSRMLLLLAVVTFTIAGVVAVLLVVQ